MFDRTGVIVDVIFDIAAIGIFDLFGSCDLDLDLMTIYELDRSRWRYMLHEQTANMNFLRQGFRKLLSDRHIDRHT